MRKTRSMKLLMSGAALVAALFVFSSETLAQSSRELGNRLSRLENEIETLSRAIYRGEQPPTSNRAGDPSMQANTEIRLQELEIQIRDLTGKVEEVSFQNRQLKNQLERMASDMELRLGDLEGGNRARPNNAVSSAGASRPSPAEPTLFNSNPAPTSNAGSNTLGTLRMNANAGSNANTTSDNAAAAYENAFSLLKSANYDAAEREFSDFLRNHKDHVLAGNAKYWLGETFYVRGDFERAARIFAEGYQQYPEGSKSADNLLKLGLSLSSIGNNQDACIALGQLEKENTSGSNPVMRRAKQEMAKLGC